MNMRLIQKRISSELSKLWRGLQGIDKSASKQSKHITSRQHAGGVVHGITIFISATGQWRLETRRQAKTRTRQRPIPLIGFYYPVNFSLRK
jgi:uncharacterized membrane protein YidH (DUF202 family)